VGLQPLLTSTIANRLLGERVVARQWGGLLLGIANAHADQVQGFYFGEPLSASELGADVLRDFRTSLGVDNRSKAETRRSSG
jgi:hypothetical protein